MLINREDYSAAALPSPSAVKDRRFLKVEDLL
jgi:hypothetical protein